MPLNKRMDKSQSVPWHVSGTHGSVQVVCHALLEHDAKVGAADDKAELRLDCVGKPK